MFCRQGRHSCLGFARGTFLSRKVYRVKNPLYKVKLWILSEEECRNRTWTHSKAKFRARVDRYIFDGILMACQSLVAFWWLFSILWHFNGLSEFSCKLIAFHYFMAFWWLVWLQGALCSSQDWNIFWHLQARWRHVQEYFVENRGDWQKKGVSFTVDWTFHWNPTETLRIHCKQGHLGTWVALLFMTWVALCCIDTAETILSDCVRLSDDTKARILDR